MYIVKKNLQFMILRAQKPQQNGYESAIKPEMERIIITIDMSEASRGNFRLMTKVIPFC
jgi:hypothetical protein